MSATDENDVERILEILRGQGYKIEKGGVTGGGSKRVMLEEEVFSEDGIIRRGSRQVVRVVV